MLIGRRDASMGDAAAIATPVSATGAPVAPVSPAEFWWAVHGRQVVLGGAAAVAVFAPRYRKQALIAGGSYFAYLLLRSAHQKGWF